MACIRDYQNVFGWAFSALWESALVAASVYPLDDRFIKLCLSDSFRFVLPPEWNAKLRAINVARRVTIIPNIIHPLKAIFIDPDGLS